LLPAEVRNEVEWIKSRSHTPCWIIPAALHGIQIIRADSAAIKKKDAFLQQISPIPHADESRAEWSRQVRIRAACWQVSIDNTGRLTIPADVGALNLLTRRDGAIVAIIAAEAFLEVWDAGDLSVHLDQNRGWWHSSNPDEPLSDRAAE